MFAYPWDLPPDVVPVVYARNQAGTEATARFWFKLFPKKFRVRDLPVEDALMEKLVNSVDPNNTVAPGKDLVVRFLAINGDLRRKNNQQLSDLRFKTEETFLDNWLRLVREVATRDYALAVEIAECRNLIKGYGDTHERGRARYDTIMGVLPQLVTSPDAAATLARLRKAANADDTGAALAAAIKDMRALPQAAE